MSDTSELINKKPDVLDPDAPESVGHSIEHKPAVGVSAVESSQSEKIDGVSYDLLRTQQSIEKVDKKPASTATQQQIQQTSQKAQAIQQVNKDDTSNVQNALIARLVVVVQTIIGYTISDDVIQKWQNYIKGSPDQATTWAANLVELVIGQLQKQA